MCLGMPMNHTFLKEGVELLAHTHTTSIEWNTALYTAGFSGMGMGPPHVLVRMVFLIHCRVTSPHCLLSGVKGVSKTNQLICHPNMVLLSRSSSAIKYSSVCVIWMWVWSRSRGDVVTCMCRSDVCKHANSVWVSLCISSLTVRTKSNEKLNGDVRTRLTIPSQCSILLCM